MEIFFLFIICVGGCWLLFSAIGEALFGKSKKDNYTFVDRSVHHHTHEHKHIHVIDDETKKQVLHLKKSEDGK